MDPMSFYHRQGFFQKPLSLTRIGEFQLDRDEANNCKKKGTKKENKRQSINHKAQSLNRLCIEFVECKSPLRVILWVSGASSSSPIACPS